MEETDGSGNVRLNERLGAACTLEQCLLLSDAPEDVWRPALGYLNGRRALTDDELDDLRQANDGVLNFVTLREFRVIARRIEKAHGIG